MEKEPEEPDAEEKVVRIQDFSRRPSGRQVVQPEKEKVEDLDEATRDLHAAAKSTMQLIWLARVKLGLPEL